MKLLPSQKNLIYDKIEKNGLSPAQFHFEETYSIKNAGSKINVIHYDNSDYYFRFEIKNKKTYAMFSPGDVSLREEAFTDAWDYQVNYFTNWLKYLKREISIEDKWERLKKEMDEVKIHFENDSDKFSAQEYEELKLKTELLRERVTKIGLLEEQVKALHSKLDHLVDSAKTMNKIDWKNLFIGSILSIIVQFSVTKENAVSLWGLIKQVFNTYFLP